ncbi:ATP-binding protein [Cupriavidus sp. D39]|uniref:ATP-binding protein n=1 Tax=Cupriavidus sp. D39 TaxID=2997877 RepID=UPI00226F5A6B|nr:ATP-binding protein [Cupriavidus sp. D39]MCY0852760.1 ATP-binding protein [Cupriavidus sp. D39]
MNLETYRPAAAAVIRQRLFMPLGTAIALIVGIWVAVALWAGWDRGTSIGRINADASRLAFAIGQSVERTMMEADQLTSLIGGAVIELGPELPLAEWTRNGYLATEPFLQTAVLDETGRIRASTNPAFEPLDLSDRAHFRVHIDNPRPTLYVSKPLVGRTSGRWVVQLSKGIVAPNGRFRGVVVVSLDPLSLTNVYKSIYLGNKGVIGVLGTEDFIFRARLSGSSATPGQFVPASSEVRKALSGPGDAQVTDESPIDGIERIFGIQRLSRGDLAVVVGYNVHEALAAYRSRLMVIVMLASAISALIVYFQFRQAKAIKNLALLADREAVVTRSLNERKQHLHALFLAVDEGIGVFDRNHVIDDANPALCSLLGVSLGELRGATPQQFINHLYQGRRPSPDATAPAELLAELSRTALSHEFTALIAFDIAASPAYSVRIVHFTSGTGCVLSIRDVTADRRDARTKSHFISAAPHELKTPLTNVMGYADLLAADLIPPEKRHGIYQTIRTQAQRTYRLASDLLDLTRLEAFGAAELSFHRVDLERLVRELIETDFSDGGRVRLASEGGPFFVMADHAALSRALRNVIENAVRFSPAGKEVDVAISTAETESGSVTLCVLDRGAGMNADSARMAFDKFYRGNRLDASAGSGLGLTIAREIALLHQGQVGLVSEIGKGTKVTLSLPSVA